MIGMAQASTDRWLLGITPVLTQSQLAKENFLVRQRDRGMSSAALLPPAVQTSPGVLAYHPLFDENFSQRQRVAIEPWLAWAPERTGTDPDGHMAGGAWMWGKCAVGWLSYSKHNARFVVKYLR